MKKPGICLQKGYLVRMKSYVNLPQKEVQILSFIWKYAQDQKRVRYPYIECSGSSLINSSLYTYDGERI